MTAKCCKNIRHGAMEGTRTPGLLIRRNRIAHFVHFIIQRQIVVLIESQLFFRCYSVASFALLARLCTCYPSLRCAENVQKCAEPKSARQNRLFRTAPKAGFQRYLLCKIFQFYPNNNLTWHIGSMAGFRTSEQTPFDIEMRFTMNKLLTCRYWEKAIPTAAKTELNGLWGSLLWWRRKKKSLFWLLLRSFFLGFRGRLLYTKSSNS